MKMRTPTSSPSDRRRADRRRRHDRLIVFRWLLFAALLPGSACQHSTSGVDTRRVSSPADRQRVRVRTQAHFERAMFLKPGDIPEGGLPFDLAPLIVQEVSSSTGPRAGRFGSWSVRETPDAGQPRFDADRPVVYWHESRVDLGQGGLSDQFSYIWWYLDLVPDDPPLPAGIRITVDENAFPLAWEVLTRDGWLRSVYVAESIERLAEARFGGPLPGRSHSIEPTVADAPDIVVARVLSDGPVPMGPFVYLTASPTKIATLTCRCMPSQADEFIETGYYELLPLSRLLEIGFTPMDRFPFVRLECMDTSRNDDERIEAGLSGVGEESALKRLRWPG